MLDLSLSLSTAMKCESRTLPRGLWDRSRWRSSGWVWRCRAPRPARRLALRSRVRSRGKCGSVTLSSPHADTLRRKSSSR